MPKIKPQPNLAACNIAADRFIVGRPAPWRDAWDETRITLIRNGDPVSTAPATDALGGPRAGLAWMLCEAEKRGLALGSGGLLITGACGGIHDAQPGCYQVDYGDLGMVEFTVA